MLPDAESSLEILTRSLRPASDFARQRPHRTAVSTSPTTHSYHDRIPPTLEAAHRAQVVEEWCLLAKHPLNLGPHDCLNQLGLVREVVVNLRLARSTGLYDIVNAGGLDALRVHEIGGCRDDTQASGLALGGQPSRLLLTHRAPDLD